MSAEDLLATSMLIMLGLAFATLLTILVSLARNAGKKDELEDLIDELEEDEDETSGRWEKDPDWWKKH